MAKIVAREFLSLDGVAQAPGGPDEDRDGGFQHGGWHMPFSDTVGDEWVLEGFERAGAFLLGRRTYEIFASYWPSAPEEEAVIAAPLNELPKYVITGTLTEPLAWQNSTVLGSDPSAVEALRDLDGKDILIFGSTKLVRSLIELGLLDELWVTVDPIVVGGGKRIFSEDGALRGWRLIDSKVTGTGVILARYEAAAPAAGGAAERAGS
jgi:dihydrofolate reductase